MESTFVRVRPLCVRILQELSAEPMGELSLLLADLPGEHVQEMQEYILFPLRVAVKSPGMLDQESLLMAVWDLVACVAGRIDHISQWAVFLDFYSHVFNQLDSCLPLAPSAGKGVGSDAMPNDVIKDAGLTNKLTESAMISGMRCACGLLNALSMEMLSQCYDSKSRPLIGVSIHLMLEILTNHRSLELRLLVIECLNLIGGAKWWAVHSSIDQSALTEILTTLGDGSRSKLKNRLSKKPLKTIPSNDVEMSDDTMKPGERGTERLKLTAGKSLKMYLPGIAVALTQACCSDPLLNHRLVIACLDCWAQVVVMVMRDAVWHGGKTDGLFPSTISRLVDTETTASTSSATSNVTQGPDDTEAVWLSNASGRLEPLIKRISTTLRTSDHYAVRLALVRWAERLVAHCSRTLASSRPVLLDTILCMLGDDYEQVSGPAMEVLNGLKEMDLKWMDTVAQESLYAFCETLPRLIQREPSEPRLLSMLRLVDGYLFAIGSAVRTFVLDQPVFHKFLFALGRTLQFNYNAVQFVTEQSNNSGDKDRGLMVDSITAKTRPIIELQGMNSRKICEHFLKIFGRLVKNVDLDLLLRSFVEASHNVLSSGPQLMWMLNITLIAVHQSNTLPCVDVKGDMPETPASPCLSSEHVTTLRDVCEHILADLDSVPLWERSQFGDEQVSSHGGSARSKHVLNIQLCLELLADVAICLGHQFEPLVLKTLYPVLEVYSTGHATLRRMALCCLEDTAFALRLPAGVAELINRYSDFLLSSIALKLRCFSVNPSCPLVLSAVLELLAESDGQFIFHAIQPIIMEMLQGTDVHHTERCAVFLRVFRDLVTHLLVWFPPHATYVTWRQRAALQAQAQQADACDDETTSLPPEAQPPCCSKQPLIDISVAADDAGGCSVGASGATDGDSNLDVDPVSTEWTPDAATPPPGHVTLVVKILERTRHFTSSHHAHLRLVTLEILKTGLRVIQPWEDQLLPMIHQNWPGVANRFKSGEDLNVTLEAWAVVLTMAEVSRSFIYRKVLDDLLLAHVTKFLQSQSAISVRSPATYAHCLGYKYQLAIMGNLLELLDNIQLVEEHFPDIVRMAFPYLNNEQPEMLRREALRLMKWLKNRDSHQGVAMETLHGLFGGLTPGGQTLCKASVDVVCRNESNAD